MNAQRLVVFVSVVSAFALGARAEVLDATKPLACDIARASECDGVAHCDDASVDEIDLPPGVTVDFAAQQLVSKDGQRTSPIASVETHETNLVLLGNQAGRGWTMVIERATGHLSATVADAEGAFVLAGSCVVR